MRKNVNDNSIYMVSIDELFILCYNTDNEKLKNQIDNIINILQNTKEKNITEIAIKSSTETDLIIEELSQTFYDEDSCITGKEMAHALIQSIKSGNKLMEKEIRNLISNNILFGRIIDLKINCSNVEEKVFDYIKEFGHYSYEEDVDERIEYETDFLLYENGEFKKVTIEAKSLKLSN